MKLMLIPYGILTFYAKSDALRTLRELKPRYPAVNLRFIQRIHKALVTTRLGNLVRTLGICAGRMVGSAHPTTTTKGWSAMRTLRELKPRHIAVNLRFIQRIHKALVTTRLGNLVRTLGICAGRMVGSAHPTTKEWCAMRTLRELKPRYPAVNLRLIQRIHKGALLLRLNRNRHDPLVRIALLILGNHRMRHLAAQ